MLVTLALGRLRRPPATAMASCTREATAEEITGFTDLASVATWATLKGDPTDPESQAGSLFALVSALEDGELCSIAEFAALEPSAYLERIAAWTHASIFITNHHH